MNICILVGTDAISDVPEARRQGRKQAQRWHTKIVFWLRGVQLLTLPRPGVRAERWPCDDMKIWVLIESGAIFDAPETRLRIGKRNWKASECVHQSGQSGTSLEPVRKQIWAEPVFWPHVEIISLNSRVASKKNPDWCTSPEIFFQTGRRFFQTGHQSGKIISQTVNRKGLLNISILLGPRQNE